MSSTHTPGRIELGKFEEHGGYDCMFAGIKAGPAQLEGLEYGQEQCEPMEEGSKARMLADARRLVACWNALTTWTTEDIEQLGGGIVIAPAILAEDRRTQAMVDALAKTETYLLERVASKVGGTGATVILPMIRRAIEGAGVAPTPSGWSDFPAT